MPDSGSLSTTPGTRLASNRPPGGWVELKLDTGELATPDMPLGGCCGRPWCGMAAGGW